MMNKRLIPLLVMLLVGLLTQGCLLKENDGREGRPLIVDFSAGDGSAAGDPDEPREDLSLGRRPGGVAINEDYCSCFNGKADLLNNCVAFCAARPATNAPILEASVRLGRAVEAHPELKSLYDWCRKGLEGGGIQPNCTLRVTDRNDGQVNLPVNIREGANNFTADLTTLRLRETYIAALVVRESLEGGAFREVSSSTIQIRRQEVDDEDNPTGPLGIQAVSQYTCYTRSSRTSGNNDFINHAVPLHFYFIPERVPPPIPPSDNLTVCHNFIRRGQEDHVRFERTKIIPNRFHLWDKDSELFLDSDEDGQVDIHDLLTERLANEYGVSQPDINLFSKFEWPNAPLVSNDNSGGNGGNGGNGEDPGDVPLPFLGFIMQAFDSGVSNRVFCPRRENYRSRSNPLFKLLEQYIGVDTEGIYLARKVDEEYFIADDGRHITLPDDLIFVRESVLKKIWFYYGENYLTIRHDENSLRNSPIYFHYPEDVNYPYLLKSYQRLYEVVAPEDINSGGVGEIPSQLRAHDKRYGCIPKAD